MEGMVGWVIAYPPKYTRSPRICDYVNFHDKKILQMWLNKDCEMGTLFWTILVDTM